jgi:hypothetical protein
MLTFLKGERAIVFLERVIAFLKKGAVDGLRWIAAFVAVALTYGVAVWMVLRPTGWQFDVNARVVEINLRDLPQPSANASSDRTSEQADPSNPTGDNAQSELAGAADTAPRAANSSASRAGDEGRDADAVRDAKDGSPDAAKTAALAAENIAIKQPRPAADATPEVPPRTEAPAADSGGGSRPTTTRPQIVAPDTGTARAPVDTSITVNQGRSLLRSTKVGPQSKSLPLPQLKLTLPLATLKEPFSKRPNPLVGLTLPAPGLMSPAAAAANQGHTQDLAQKPAIGAAGGVMRNAIGIIIEQRTAVAHAGASLLGVHPLPRAMSTAMHASSEHSPMTTAAGAPLVAGNASPRDARLATGATNQPQAGHADRGLQADHVATIGGPAINGASMNRPASSTGRSRQLGARRCGRAQWLQLPYEAPMNAATASPKRHRCSTVFRAAPKSQGELNSLACSCG